MKLIIKIKHENINTIQNALDKEVSKLEYFKLIFFINKMITQAFIYYIH